MKNITSREKISVLEYNVFIKKILNLINTLLIINYYYKNLKKS